MSNDNELLIKINADVKNVKAAFDDVKSQTEHLEESLKGLAEISGVAFAALVAQVTIAVHEFAKADTASKQLSGALQDQGIYTKELKDSYKEYAEQISEVTGISQTQITQAQSVLQTYLGQIPITEELTKATADLAEKQKIDLVSAAKEVGLAIGNGTGMLLRQGLTFSSTATEAQRYAQTLQFVSSFAKDASTDISPVTLATKKLENAFEENSIALGERFAPAIASAIDLLSSFLKPSKESTGAMVDFKVALIVTGLALTGLGTAAGVASVAVIAVRAALIAVNSQLTVTKALLSSLGIGLVISALAFGITLLVENFSKVKSVVLPILAGFVAFFAEMGKGFIKFATGDFKEGFEQMHNASKAFKDAELAEQSKLFQAQTAEANKEAAKQDADKKALADKRAKDKSDESRRLLALTKAENELVQLENEGASDKLIELKKQEIEVLKLLSAKKNGEDKRALETRVAQIRTLEVKANEEEVQRNIKFNEDVLATKKQLNDTKIKYDDDLTKKEINAIKKSQLTRKEAEQKVYQDTLKEKIKQNNTFLEEQAKYGTAYATINSYIHSSELQGLQQATTDLAQMTQSKNSTLKEIGKIASVANIVIKTAESAMNIYAGFSAIPIVGPALGIAGAAAAVAFGAEQIGNVTAANTGGLIPGGGPNRDSTLLFATPGEFVTPRNNYEETINGAIQQRGYVKADEQNQKGSQMGIKIGFDGRQAQQVLTAQQVQAKSLGTYRAKS